jgi:Cdc6-like AAA superfamily ATPase
LQRADLLQKLDIGNSVAEFDRALERYFVETALFRDFVADRYDIVSGDKGTGKTAIFRFVTEHRRDYDELHDIDLLPGLQRVRASGLLRTDPIPSADGG